jgi:hypothetical protein
MNNQSKKIVNVCIVGGGITGLSAAVELCKNKEKGGSVEYKISLFESQERLGGNMVSKSLSSSSSTDQSYDGGALQIFSWYKQIFELMETVGAKELCHEFQLTPPLRYQIKKYNYLKQSDYFQNKKTSSSTECRSLIQDNSEFLLNGNKAAFRLYTPEPTQHVPSNQSLFTYFSNYPHIRKWISTAFTSYTYPNISEVPAFQFFPLITRNANPQYSFYGHIDLFVQKIQEYLETNGCEIILNTNVDFVDVSSYNNNKSSIGVLGRQFDKLILANPLGTTLFKQAALPARLLSKITSSFSFSFSNIMGNNNNNTNSSSSTATLDVGKFNSALKNVAWVNTDSKSPQCRYTRYLSVCCKCSNLPQYDYAESSVNQQHWSAMFNTPKQQDNEEFGKLEIRSFLNLQLLSSLRNSGLMLVYIMVPESFEKEIESLKEDQDGQILNLIRKEYFFQHANLTENVTVESIEHIDVFPHTMASINYAMKTMIDEHNAKPNQSIFFAGPWQTAICGLETACYSGVLAAKRVLGNEKDISNYEKEMKNLDDQYTKDMRSQLLNVFNKQKLSNNNNHNQKQKDEYDTPLYQDIMKRASFLFD